MHKIMQDLGPATTWWGATHHPPLTTLMHGSKPTASSCVPLHMLFPGKDVLFHRPGYYCYFTSLPYPLQKMLRGVPDLPTLELQTSKMRTDHAFSFLCFTLYICVKVA